MTSLSSLDLVFEAIRGGDLKSVRQWICDASNSQHESSKIVLKERRTGRTMLDVATISRRDPIVDYLLNEYGSNILEMGTGAECIGYDYWSGKRKIDSTANLLLEKWQTLIYATLRVRKKRFQLRDLRDLLDYPVLRFISVDDLAQLLCTATKYGSTTIVQTFLEGCSKKTDRFKSALNHDPSDMKMTAIHHAIVENRPQIVRLLIRYGARMTPCDVLPEFTPSRAMLKCLRRLYASSSSSSSFESPVKSLSSHTSNIVATCESLPHRLFDYISLHRLEGKNISNLERADIMWRYPEKDRKDFAFPNEYNSIFFAWPFLHHGWIEDHNPSATSSVVSVFVNRSNCDHFRFHDGVVTTVSEEMTSPFRRGDVFVRIDGEAVVSSSQEEEKISSKDERIKHLLLTRCTDKGRTTHVEVLRKNIKSEDMHAIFSTALHQASNLPTVYVTCLTFSGNDDEAFALCLFSHYPFLHMQERLLRHLVHKVFSNPQLLSSSNVGDEESLVSKLLDQTPLPAEGGTGVTLTTSTGFVLATFTRNRTHALPMVQSSMFDMLFSHFNAQSVLDILSHLMTSRSSVLLVSKRIDLLTPISEAILALLFPLRLVEHVYIPVLPPSVQYARYLHSPIPVFAGIHTSAVDLVFSADHTVTPNVVLCHVDTGKVVPSIVSDRSTTKIATIPGFISRVAARDMTRHIHAVQEGHVTVDVPRIRTAICRMFCALMDGFTPRVLVLSIEDDSELENDWIFGHCKNDRSILEDVKKEEFYRQLFESAMWVSFVHEYLYEIRDREAQLDVFDRYRSIWTSPEETRGGDVSRVLFPHARKSVDMDEEIKVSLGKVMEQKLSNICRRVFCEKVDDDNDDGKGKEEGDLNTLDAIREKLKAAKMRVKMKEKEFDAAVSAAAPLRESVVEKPSCSGSKDDGGETSESSGGFSDDDDDDDDDE